MTEFIRQMEVELARGENKFTMKRGSFHYRTTTGHKKHMHFHKKRSSEEALHFRTFFRKGQCEFKVEEMGFITHLTCTSYPEDVNRWTLTFPVCEDAHYYGCGETYSTLDLKGENVRIWVAEHQNTSRIGSKILRNTVLGNNPDRVLKFGKYESYYAQPTFVSSEGYFVHVNTDAYSEIDFSRPDEVTIRLQTPPDLYVGVAESFPQLSTLLSSLLGKQRKLPEWIYDGGILAIQQGPNVIDEKLRKAKEAGAAINGVWSQDWCGCRKTGFGYQVMWNWEYDKELYPDLPKRILEWNREGVRFLGYINPFLALEKPLYQEASKKGYCVRKLDGSDYLVTITTFPAAMVDFTNPEAYAWYKNIIKKNMIGIGMSGWMADFGEYLPTDCILHSGEDAALVHNRWPEYWAKMNREAIEECGKEDEVFFFTRSGHTGTIAASDMMWTGDQHVDWSVDDGLPSVIPATLSLAMSGYCITHSDVGGYTTVLNMTRSKELLQRWIELSAFSPLFRSHEGNQPGRNVQFDDDEELLAQLARFTTLHKNLGWYLKDLEQEATEDGIPVMRPIFYHYPQDAFYKEKGAYLLGRDVLVAPVLQKETDVREVVLPQDVWIHAFSGAEYLGGTYSVSAPIGKPPVFLRKNSPVFDQLMESFSSCK